MQDTIVNGRPRKLNILIYPMLSIDTINGDSNYIIIKQLCNELVKTGKYNFLLILDSGRKYIPDDLSPLVKIIKIPLPNSKKKGVIHFNSNIWFEIWKKYSIDIIWNNVVEQGHHFKYFNDTFDEKSRVKVFNYHHYVIHRSLKDAGSYDQNYHIMLDQFIGSLGADINYFHSDWCYQMLIEEAKEVLNETNVQKIMDKSIVHLGGYCEELPSEKKYEKFTFIWNHRIDGYKNWKETFKMFDDLWEWKPYSFQVIMTGADKDKVQMLTETKPYVLLKRFTKHNEYLLELQKCHANAINSLHETYCISIAESMMANHVIFAPNRCTFPQLLGGDYPYIFNKPEEQLEMIKRVIEEGKWEWQHKNKNILTIKSHANFIDEQFSKMITIERINKKGENIGTFLEKIKKQENAKKIKLYLENKVEIDFDEFKKWLTKNFQYGPQSFPNNKIGMLLREFGFEYHTFANKWIKNIS